MISKKEKMNMIKNELKKTEYWKPCLSQISRNIGVPISTIFDYMKEMEKKNEIEIFVEVITE